MVHKRYVKKNGKLIGPYYYESYREGGKVKKRYIGTKLPKSMAVVVLQIIFASLMIILLGMLAYKGMTGNVILSVQEQAVLNENLSGIFNMVLSDGDIVSKDALVLIQLKKEGIVIDQKEITLENFINGQAEAQEIVTNTESCTDSSLVDQCADVIIDENTTIQNCTQVEVPGVCTNSSVSAFYYNSSGNFERQISDFISYTFSEPGNYQVLFEIPALNLMETREFVISTPEEQNIIPEVQNQTENQTIDQTINQTINQSEQINTKPLANNSQQIGVLSTPGDIASCQVLDTPGTYTLTVDLTPTATCFNVTIDGVIIDGQGHSITGSGAGYGVDTSNLTGPGWNISLKNIRISGFTSDVYGAGGDFALTNGGTGSNIEVINSTIQNLTSVGGYGDTGGDAGAVSIFNSSINTINSLGGGFVFANGGNAGKIDINGSVVNKINSIGGYGITGGSSNNITISYSTIGEIQSFGRGGTDGGGNGGILVIVNSTTGLINNSGAIGPSVEGGNANSITITNSTVGDILNNGGNGGNAAGYGGKGGSISLDNSHAGIISSNGGSGYPIGGTGGNLIISSSTTDNISTNGGYGWDIGLGSGYGGFGGNITISSSTTGTINSNGGGSDSHGGRSGVINITNSNVTTISANGGNSFYIDLGNGGSGQTITITNSNTSSITANGGNNGAYAGNASFISITNSLSGAISTVGGNADTFYYAGLGGNVIVTGSNIISINSTGGRGGTAGEAGAISVINSSVSVVFSGGGFGDNVHGGGTGAIEISNSSISVLSSISGNTVGGDVGKVGTINITNSNLVNLSAVGGYSPNDGGDTSLLKITQSVIGIINFTGGKSNSGLAPNRGGNTGAIEISNSSISRIYSYGGGSLLLDIISGGYAGSVNITNYSNVDLLYVHGGFGYEGGNTTEVSVSNSIIGYLENIASDGPVPPADHVGGNSGNIYITNSTVGNLSNFGGDGDLDGGNMGSCGISGNITIYNSTVGNITNSAGDGIGSFGFLGETCPSGVVNISFSRVGNLISSAGNAGLVVGGASREIYIANSTVGNVLVIGGNTSMLSGGSPKPIIVRNSNVSGISSIAGYGQGAYGGTPETIEIFNSNIQNDIISKGGVGDWGGSGGYINLTSSFVFGSVKSIGSISEFVDGGSGGNISLVDSFLAINNMNLSFGYGTPNGLNGYVKFNNSGIFSSSGKITFSYLETNLTNIIDIINITTNRAFVNSTYSDYNVPADVTLYNTGISSPVRILKDGAACTTCSLLSTSGTDYVFNVTGWSTYTLETISNPISGGGSPGSGGGAATPACESSYSCSPSGPCVNGFRNVLCVDSACGKSDKTETIVCQVELCVPQWSCSDWSACSSGVSTRTCTDSKACPSATGKPSESLTCGIPVDDKKVVDDKNPTRAESQLDGCTPKFECGNWGECNYNQRIEDIFNGEIKMTGTREKECVDVNKCTQNYNEEEPCVSAIKVELQEQTSCGEKKVVAVSSESKVPITNINLDAWKANRLEVSFVQSNVVYCPSCYDGIQDANETEIDCGGECRACKLEGKQLSSLVRQGIEIGSWTLAVLLLSSIVYVDWSFIRFQLLRKKVHVRM